MQPEIPALDKAASSRARSFLAPHYLRFQPLDYAVLVVKDETYTIIFKHNYHV